MGRSPSTTTSPAVSSCVPSQTTFDDGILGSKVLWISRMTISFSVSWAFKPRGSADAWPTFPREFWLALAPCLQERMGTCLATCPRQLLWRCITLCTSVVFVFSLDNKVWNFIKISSSKPFRISLSHCHMLYFLAKPVLCNCRCAKCWRHVIDFPLQDTKLKPFHQATAVVIPLLEGLSRGIERLMCGAFLSHKMVRPTWMQKNPWWSRPGFTFMDT